MKVLSNLISVLVWAICLVLSIGCGRDSRPATMLDTPQAVSCEEQGKVPTWLNGNQYCSKSGFFCLAKGETPPCN